MKSVVHIIAPFCPTRLRHLLERKRYSQARSLLLSAKQNFPEHPVFGPDLDAASALKAAFMVHHSTLVEANKQQQQTQEGENGVQEGGDSQASAVSDLERQKVVVSYLKDSVAFAVELNAALPTMCMLLGSKQARTDNSYPFHNEAN